MLPAGHRLTRRADFADTTRRGFRARRGALVVHLLPVPGPTLVGFVVSKAVGGSVVRHRVTRRLRALVGEQLPLLPSGARIVVRALPEAATRTSADLAEDLHEALGAAWAKSGRQ